MTDTSSRSRSPQIGSLVQLVEPLFLYICRLNRVARNQGQLSGTSTGAPFGAHTPPYERTRAEIGRLLAKMKDESAGDGPLSRQFDQVELPLVFFVDSIIAESQLPYREQWHENRLAAERGKLGGDDEFFELLDACLADASEEATERLVVFFTCLGLGFTGKYVDDPLQIDTRMQRVAHRIRRRWLNRDFEKRLSPQCYEHTDKSNLPKPSRDSVLTMGFVALAAGLILLGAYRWIYNESVGQLHKLVEKIATASATPVNHP